MTILYNGLPLSEGLGIPSKRGRLGRSALRRCLGLFLVVCGNLMLAASVPARGLPAQEGILNFGKVSEHLYRGAQPDATGLKHLKQLGVKLIVNLRMPGDGWKEEAAEAAACGILYTNFPMHGITKPTGAQVDQILSLFESCTDPIFIHCRHGCDRTGTVVACYRIQHDHWSNALALTEANYYGISRFEIRMRKFVRQFKISPKAGSLQARAN